MRLSTDPARDEARALAVLHAALDAGIRFFDTADAYCHDEAEVGHNERLIARALRSWSGDASQVRVATKGGLTRPQGRWECDGRAKHLVAACCASRRALGVERIHLYQLHAPDPRTPLATSVRALDTLKRDGLIEGIGLCNVTVGQIEAARRLTEIDAVQVELSIWHDRHLLSGVVEYCLTHRIPLLAHRPLGGPQRRDRMRNDPALVEIAARHGATAHEIALAWLMDLSTFIIPVPGATRVATVGSIARATSIVLDNEDRERLDRRVPPAAWLRAGRTTPAAAARLDRDGEVVLIMELPAAGKSTLAATLTARGYARLNRDESGGTLRDLLPALDRALAEGASHIVLDNTYVSRRSRAEVIRAATARGLPVRCVWLATSLEDAQTNAIGRLVKRAGRLPLDTELRQRRKRDTTALLPTVQFRYQRDLEPPDIAEGFSSVEVVPFERRHDPTAAGRAVILWCDGVLLCSRSGRRVPLAPEDVEVPAGRGAVLRRYRESGWRVLGISWQPEIADGSQTPAGAAAVFARLNELLGLTVEVEYCPHPAGPPTCWCRKPLPGLGVLFVTRHRLAPAQCLYVGVGAHDQGFARRLGFSYCDADAFFDRPNQGDLI